MADQVDKKAVDEDDDDKHSWLSHVVRIALMVWACAIITSNYLGIFKQSIDVTFSASLLSSMAASYGLSVGRNAPKKKEEPKADSSK
jgi:hypothetical protein